MSALPALSSAVKVGVLPASFDLAKLAQFLLSKLPPYAVPVFLRILPECVVSFVFSSSLTRIVRSLSCTERLDAVRLSFVSSPSSLSTVSLLRPRVLIPPSPSSSLSPRVPTTGTFKHQKTSLRKEGADPSLVDDPLFILDVKSKTYVPLTMEKWGEVASGRVKL